MIQLHGPYLDGGPTLKTWLVAIIVVMHIVVIPNMALAIIIVTVVTIAITSLFGSVSLA